MNPLIYNRILCVYPYRNDGFHAGFLPPLGLELIASVLEPSCRALEIVDLRKRPGRTIDFCRPETDLVCFSVNWKRDVEFIREEIRSVRQGAFRFLPQTLPRLPRLTWSVTANYREHSKRRRAGETAAETVPV